MTALHWACYKGNLFIVQRLLDNGCDIEAKDILGRTPIYFAVLFGNYNVVEVFI